MRSLRTKACQRFGFSPEQAQSFHKGPGATVDNAIGLFRDQKASEALAIDPPQSHRAEVVARNAVLAQKQLNLAGHFCGGVVNALFRNVAREFVNLGHERYHLLDVVVVDACVVVFGDVVVDVLAWWLDGGGPFVYHRHLTLF